MLALLYSSCNSSLLCEGIPNEIDKLYNLERLNLYNNYVSDLPSALCSLSKLKYLNVGYVCFSNF